MMSSIIVWPILAVAIIILTLPLYTILLAIITIIRAKWRHHPENVAAYGKTTSNNDNPLIAASCSSPWSNIRSSFFRGTVFHIRHKPVIHAFKYPLYFSVVDLDEASELFGTDNVIHPSQSPVEEGQHQRQPHSCNARGALWPLSSLMLLRDIDHLKNGEGLLNNNNTETNAEKMKSIKNKHVSMRERICNIVHERTNGKLDLRYLTIRNNDTKEGMKKEGRRKIILVTHLMYYGYCFNPVSLFFILKSKTINSTEENQNEDEEDEIEAIVVEVSNTPWNEMSIYVLHPDSIDTLEHSINPTPPSPITSVATKFNATTHRYKWQKNFHVSPFMTMDFDYDWKFQVSRDRIKVEATMIRRSAKVDRVVVSTTNHTTTTTSNKTEKKDNNSDQLFFTAGFDIQRTILHQPTYFYPLQLANIILRFPVYCFIIQLWIHYEAIKLLIKGVQFIPHPQGSETGASRAIAMVMRPIFGVANVLDVWWSKCKGGQGDGKCKEA